MRHKIVLFCLLATIVCSSAFSQTAFETLQTKWYNYITTYTSSRPYDTATVGGYWRRLIKTPGRTRLWSEYDFQDASGNYYSADITLSYSRLTSMTLAWAIPASGFYQNDSLKTDIVSALDWLYDNEYNPTVPHPTNTSNATLNWWDYQIGTPLQINDLVTMLYDDLSATQKDNYLGTVDHFSPDFKQRYASADSNNSFTAANRVWISNVIALRGILVRDSTKIKFASDSLSPVFLYTTTKDGFYTDGSFVQHQNFAYTGGYGKSLMELLADELFLLKNSPWQVTDPNVNNVYKWVLEAFAPIMYRGGLMSSTLGREISWSVHEELRQGREVTQFTSILSDLASAADTLKLKELVKAWALAQDTSKAFPPRYQPFINRIVLNATIKPDTSFDKVYRQFANMDRAVHRNGNYAVAISMHSASRMMNFEGSADENLKGWHTGDGMTYLYNADTSQFNSNFWPTVDSYRLPGTTVQDSTKAAAYKLSGSTWVGGVGLLNRYGTTGFDYAPYSQDVDARKSWFMLDGKIVALGAAIVTGGTKRVHTYIDQRKLKGNNSNTFTINGTSYPALIGTNGQPDSVVNASWAHISGNMTSTDVGYYFPGNMTLKMLRRQQTGAWKDLNLNQSATQLSNYYLTLWKDHGINATNTESDANRYAYVLLPGYSAAQTGVFAASPGIQIIANTATVQAVKDSVDKIVAANFWLAQSTSINTNGTNGYMTCNSRAAVITKISGDTLYVSASDPTMSNTSGIRLWIKERVQSVLFGDPQMQVISIQDSIQLLVQTSGLKGRSSMIAFKLGNSPVVNNTCFTEHFNYTATDALIGKANPAGTNWLEHTGYPVSNGNPIAVRSGDLNFSGYPSGGNSIQTKFAAVVGAGALIRFPVGSGSILPATATSGITYLSFLVNVSRSMSTTSHFISFATNTGTLRSRVWVRRNTVPGLSFGVGHNTTSTSNAFTAAAKVYPVNTTLLLVIKYQRTAAGKSDTMSLYVFDPANGGVPSTEPATPDAKYSETGTFYKPDIDGFTILQPARNASENTDVTILADGFIADTVWTTSATILPVRMMYVNAARAKNSVQVAWATATETNNDHFDVLRSTNSVDFTYAGAVKGTGTSSFKTDYSFTDKTAPKDALYYKLKQVDKDGKISYSNIVRVAGDGKMNEVNILVSGRTVTALCEVTTSGNYQLKIYNMSGQLLAHQKLRLSSGTTALQLPTLVQSGTYLLELSNGQQSLHKKYVLP